MSNADSSIEILDIDEILKDDSFCLSSENIQEDITSILQQWKLNDKFQYGNKQVTGSKLIDTRTFTRPKKRLNLEASCFSNRNNDHLTECSTTPVNLQIGGLVTSMQKSFLNDTSPPSTMSSSIDMSCINNDKMNNSLITSNDFTNINFLINSFDELNSQSNFNGYNLENVISDRKFLENLSISNDETFLKDSCISKTDNYLEEISSSGHSTLHNSDEFFINNGILNETFIPSMLETNHNNITVIYENDVKKSNNETFTTNGDINQDINLTFNQSTTTTKETEINLTYPHMINLNETFPKTNDIESKDCSVNSIQNETFDLILQKSDDSLLIDNNSKIISNNDNNVLLRKKPFENVTPIKNTTFNSQNFIIDTSIINNDDDDSIKDTTINILQSTPLNTPSLRNPRNSLNLSPITCKSETKHKIIENNIINCTNKMEEFEKYLNDVGQQYSLTPEDDLLNDSDTIKQEDERRSLANFEEFEKSMLMLEDNKTEKEFDDILNSLNNNENKMHNEKMRQNIDSIKKRHYLINLEKQKVEQIIKNKNSESIENNIIDSNKLNESFGKSMNSSSGSERLLNRRSRMYDDISSSQEIDTKDICGTDDGGNNSKPVIAESVDNNYEKHNNRDRFKTIRIFKRPEDNTFVLPDAERTSVEGILSDEHFNKKDINSPQLLQQQQQQQDNRMMDDGDNNEHINITKKNETNASTLRRPRALSKPRFFGRKESSTLSQPIKSSSANDLDRNSENELVSESDGQNSKNNQSKQQSKLKSPMGVKAKSIHNLLGGGGIGNVKPSLSLRPNGKIAYTSQLPSSQYNNELKSQTNTNTFTRPLPVKPVNNELHHINRRDNTFATGQLKARNTMVRPTSAYYNYNVKKTDSDESSGHCSPNSLSSSSASSKGSLYQPVTTEKHQQMTCEQTAISTSTATSIKPSSIRPNNRPPTGGSRLPRPSGIPRR